ncbi:MAG: hypothetical protein JW795_15725 [Chitinivibrionales bacterium]|nr:hypothetical protein [Chitinivibrionales bacterium]
MKWTISLFLVAVVTSLSTADTTTVVLQNGLNSYTGCEDTWLLSGIDFPNGTDEMIAVKDEWCET